MTENNILVSSFKVSEGKIATLLAQLELLERTAPRNVIVMEQTAILKTDNASALQVHYSLFSNHSSPHFILLPINL